MTGLVMHRILSHQSPLAVIGNFYADFGGHSRTHQLGIRLVYAGNRIEHHQRNLLAFVTKNRAQLFDFSCKYFIRIGIQTDLELLAQFNSAGFYFRDRHIDLHAVEIRDRQHHITGKHRLALLELVA